MFTWATAFMYTVSKKGLAKVLRRCKYHLSISKHVNNWENSYYTSYRKEMTLLHAVTFHNCRKITPNHTVHQINLIIMYIASTECWCSTANWLKDQVHIYSWLQRYISTCRLYGVSGGLIHLPNQCNTSRIIIQCVETEIPYMNYQPYNA